MIDQEHVRKLREGLSPEKRALLERRLRGESGGESARCVVVRRPSDGPAPLSFAQQRLWFLDQLVPGSPAYNISVGVRLRGRLDETILEWSLQEIVRRHETLRTTFPLVGGDAIQAVVPTLLLRPCRIDLAALPVERRETCATEVALLEAVQPFDLACGPLLRVLFVQLSASEYLVLLTLHHIVSDGWSLGVLIRELMEFYQTAATGQPSLLPELPVQYADFAIWQREWLGSGAEKVQLNVWRRRLGGELPILELPLDHPRPAVQTFHGAVESVFHPAAAVDRLRGLARQWEATLFMVLLAAFDVWLARSSGQSDLLVGTPVAGRNRAETEGLIGLFVNTLVLRSDLTGDPSVGELLARVRAVTLEAFAHQDLPFERLVEVLQPRRDVSRSPLFQVLFMLDNIPVEEMQFPDLEVSPFRPRMGKAQFDLTLIVVETGPNLEITLDYNTDLFEAVTIQRALGQLERLLNEIGADPSPRLSGLPLLMEAERWQLIGEWNDTGTARAAEPTLLDLLEEQARRCPEAVAVVSEGVSLTQAELHRRAGLLAARLRRLRVGPEVLVGLAVERSLELVVGVLGILKAGGAYLPLDPDHPRERLAAVLEDARVPVVVSRGEAARVLPDSGAVRVDLDEVLAAAAEGAPPVSLDALHPAYVIFTSGSTGRPKGVVNTHRGIVNRLLWMQERYGLGPEDRVLQKTPVGFDVSVWELFWPLLTGARLVMARPRGHLDSAYLVRLIADEGITTVHFVPSMLQIFLEESGIEDLSLLRRVICSGEALPFALKQRFHERLRAELHNLYGPTEAAVDVTAWECARPGDGPPVVPIGRPITNTRVHLVDAWFQPAPIGVAGELCIGGTNLARGYLGRPDLTADRFVPDPFGPPGECLYRTGDLARFRPDGSIEYLGRTDHQVKIRGVRVELGEVEAALRRDPRIRAAVVVAASGPGGDLRLVAYFAAPETESPSPRELRECLLEILPEAMIPALLVRMDELPLSPNGKVNRHALPPPEWGRHTVREAFAPPLNQLERTVAAIWQEVLQIESVGRHDNFFDLGGHSLLMVRVRLRLQEILQRDLPVLELFRYPTVSSVAEYLGRGAGEAVEEDRSERLREGKLRLQQRLQRRRHEG